MIEILINKKKSRTGDAVDQYNQFRKYIEEFRSQDDIHLKIGSFVAMTYKAIESNISEHEDFFYRYIAESYEIVSGFSVDTSIFRSTEKYCGNGLLLRKNKHVAYYSLLSSELHFYLYTEKYSTFQRRLFEEFLLVKKMLESECPDFYVAYGNIIRIFFFQIVLFLKKPENDCLLNCGVLIIKLFKGHSIYIHPKSIRSFNELNQNFNKYLVDLFHFLECIRSNQILNISKSEYPERLSRTLYNAALHGPIVKKKLGGKFINIFNQS